MPSLISSLTGEGIAEASRYGGLMLFAFAAMQFLFSPLLGNLSDQYGRRPVLLFSLLGFGIDYFLLANAPTIGWLFAGRIIAGITGASFSTATAYIADISKPEDRARNFGLMGAAFGLGFIIGPVLGGVLGNSFGPRFPFLAAGTLTLINFLYGLFVLPESLSSENRRKFDWRRANPFGAIQSLKNYPGLLGLFLALFFFHLGSHAVQSTWNFYTKGEFNWSEEEIGYSLGFVGLLVSIVQAGLIRHANARFGQIKSVYLGFFFFFIGLFVFAFAYQSWILYVGLIPYCLSGIGGPSLQGIMSSKVPSNSQGELQGAFTSMVALSSIFGPPLMTTLYSTFAAPVAPVHFPGAAFLAGSVFALLSLFLVWRQLSQKAA